MKRDINALTRKEFDLLIVGGGIYGLACARDAAMRGLSVALLEKQDFGGQTSANSAKIAHCGMRYIQHLDIKRMRESIRERNNLHQNAPHLVESQPFLMPTYGHGIKGKEILSIYLKIYDWLSPERKKFSDKYRMVPDSKVISKEDTIKQAPGIKTEGLTGGATWYEGQMQNTERLSFSILKSAEEHGAQFANYAAVIKILSTGNKVLGAVIEDLMSGETHTVKAKYVLNAAGPWAKKIFALSDLEFKNHGIYASKAFSLLTRPVSEKYAITFPIRPMYEDKKAVVKKESSLQFAIPWRNKSMFASLHLPCNENPEDVTITEKEVNTYIERINQGYPGINLKPEDVDHILWGIIPAEGPGSAAPLKHYKIIDHSKHEGIQGFGTVVGVKYTTARDVAEKTIDMVTASLDKPGTRITTLDSPIWGGDIKNFVPFVDEQIARYKEILNEKTIIKLVKTYGSKIDEVLELARNDSALSESIGESNVIAAQIIYAVRNEIAETLADVILRRTDLGSAGYPGDEIVRKVANLIAEEKAWSQDEIDRQIKMLKSSYLVLPGGVRP